MIVGIECKTTTIIRYFVEAESVKEAEQKYDNKTYGLKLLDEDDMTHIYGEDKWVFPIQGEEENHESIRFTETKRLDNLDAAGEADWHDVVKEVE